MSAARLTAAEARALGLDPSSGSKGTATARKRTTGRVVKGAPYHTICVSCSAEFHTQAAEDRHLKEFHHARYRLVLGYSESGK